MNAEGSGYLKRGQMMMARARLTFFLGHPDAAQAEARRALAELRGAMNWLEDTVEFEVAHFRLDEAGRWIREAFGCWLTREGLEYSRTCPADLAHSRVGMSLGMSDVVRECSVCGQEPRDPSCRHIRGRTYTSTRRLIGGHCNLCGLSECAHRDGEIGAVPCTHLITSVKLDEISLVPRPAQPMARIEKVTVPTSELKEEFGPRGWVPGADVSCDRCLRPCRGVREYDPTQSPGENST